MRNEATMSGRRGLNTWRWLVFVVMVLIGLGLGVATSVGSFTSESAVAIASFVVSAATGGLIIFRRDGHTTGWLLVLLGLAIVFANGFSSIPGVSDGLAAWVGSWAWSLVFSVFALLALTFPSGHLPRQGRGARWARIAAWSMPVLVLIGAIAQPLDTGVEGAANPVGLGPDWLGWVAPLGPLLILMAATVSLVLRRRRAQGVERAQLTLIVFALFVLAATIALTFAFIILSIAVGAGDPGDDAWTLAFVEMLLFPIAFAVAILRYRLFEIDRIVRRTVSYTLVVGVSAVVFAAIAVGLPQLLGLTEDSPPLLVAGATLTVAALFNPLRRRVQSTVDRRFNRARYDAQREVERFAERLRTRLQLDDLPGEVIGVVAQTVQPASATLWIRESSP